MRQRMVPRAQGVIVEVGFGSGLNLPYYDPSKVTRLIGVDPDDTMLSLAKRQSAAVPFAVECVQAGAESMPLADGFADTAVVAYALCTIPEPQMALAEIRRILKPGGRLVFLEHGQAEPGFCKGVQNWLNRVWGALAGGCNLNRNWLRAMPKSARGLRTTSPPIKLSLPRASLVGAVASCRLLSWLTTSQHLCPNDEAKLPDPVVMGEVRKRNEHQPHAKRS